MFDCKMILLHFVTHACNHFSFVVRVIAKNNKQKNKLIIFNGTIIDIYVHTYKQNDYFFNFQLPSLLREKYPYKHNVASAHRNRKKNATLRPHKFI